MIKSISTTLSSNHQDYIDQLFVLEVHKVVNLGFSLSLSS